MCRSAIPGWQSGLDCRFLAPGASAALSSPEISLRVRVRYHPGMGNFSMRVSAGFGDDPGAPGSDLPRKAPEFSQATSINRRAPGVGPGCAGGVGSTGEKEASGCLAGVASRRQVGTNLAQGARPTLGKHCISIDLSHRASH